MSDIPHLPMTFDGALQNAQRVNYKDRAMGMFYMHAELQGLASQEAGHPVYKDVAYVKIMQPGEKDTVERPARREDHFRFPQQWGAFQAKQEQRAEGTPLSVLFPHRPAVVKTLDHMGVTTIEQLAGLQGTQLQGIGLGASEWQAMAKNFTDSAEKSKPFHKMQGELDKKELELAAQRDLIEKMEARLADLESDKPRRGRPPKETE